MRFLLLLGTLIAGATAHTDRITDHWDFATRQPGRRLQAAVNKSIASGASMLTIAPGTYSFDSVDLMVNGARDLTIVGGVDSSRPTVSDSTVRLLFTCNWGVVLRSCVNVSLRGVTIDYDPPCFSQGNVTAPPTTQSNNTLTYTVEEGFPVPDLVAQPRFAVPRIKVRMWEPDGHGDWKSWHGSTDCSPITSRHLGGRSYEITNKKEWTIFPTGPLRVTLAPRLGHTLLLTNSTRCLIEGVTVHGTSDMALVDYGGGGANVWRGNRVARAAGRLLASNADMFQTVGGAEQGPIVEDNVLEYADDDCMNIHNYFSVVLKANGTDRTQILVADAVGEADATAADYPYHQQLNTFSRAIHGDVLRMYDWAKLSLRLTTTITGVRESLNPADLELANEVYKTRHINQNWAGVVRVYWVTVRDPLPAAAGDNAVINLDRLSGAGAIVRNNTMRHCTGLRFKSIGGQLIGNTLNSTFVTVNTWQQWGEGSAGLRDIVVANNTFLTCRPPPYVTQGLGNVNVTIINNTAVCHKLSSDLPLIV